jgi:hypothetical protein
MEIRHFLCVVQAEHYFDQLVTPLPLTAETQQQSWVNARDIFGGQIGIRKVFL